MPFLTFTIIMLLFNSLEVYFVELSRIKWWLFSLNGLFAFQYNISALITEEKNSVGINGHSTTLSMMACCMHHIGEFIPLIGASVFASFLFSVQSELLLFALGINMLSLVYLFKRNKHTHFQSRLLNLVFSLDYKVISILFSLIFTLVFFVIE